MHREDPHDETPLDNATRKKWKKINAEIAGCWNLRKICLDTKLDPYEHFCLQATEIKGDAILFRSTQTHKRIHCCLRVLKCQLYYSLHTHPHVRKKKFFFAILVSFFLRSYKGRRLFHFAPKPGNIRCLLAKKPSFYQTFSFVCWLYCITHKSINIINKLKYLL